MKLRWASFGKVNAAEVRRTYPLEPAQIVAELVALSVVEYGYSPTMTIALTIDGDRCELSDTGRGMSLEPDPGDVISHAERALTSIYPIDPRTDEVKDLLTRLVWQRRGSLGPVLANANCPEFVFVSRRRAEEWTQRFEYGVPTGPASRVGPTDVHGTTIRLRAEGEIDVNHVRLIAEELRTQILGLIIIGVS
jgi:DNA gyrase/topoisomerase IV subunit B